jgi:hypothetical protein
MPKYYNIPNWKNKGIITITPQPWWRRVIILNILPYHVGDNVRFHVHIDTSSPKSDTVSFIIFEKISEEITNIADGNKSDVDVIGSRIYSEGDVVYYIGVNAYKERLEPIFTTTVNSWDTIRDKWFLLIGGAVIGWLFSYGINIIKGLNK